MTMLALLYPTLAALDGASSFVDMAESRLSSARWGALYAQAVAHLAAHMLLLRQQAEKDAAAGTSSAGPVTARKAGDLSENYGSLAASALTTGDAALATTVAGRAYLELRSQCGARGPRYI